MNKTHLKVGFAALVITISASAFADEIYKWTDQDGNVYYEDRPSGNPSEEQLQLSYNRTNSEALQNRVEAQSDAEDSRQEAREQAAEDERVVEEELLAAEEKQVECASHRARLEKLVASERIYRLDDAGERTYLDEAQRAESRTQAETMVKETCDS